MLQVRVRTPLGTLFCTHRTFQSSTPSILYSPLSQIESRSSPFESSSSNASRFMFVDGSRTKFGAIIVNALVFSMQKCILTVLGSILFRPQFFVPIAIYMLLNTTLRRYKQLAGLAEEGVNLFVPKAEDRNKIDTVFALLF